MMENVNECLNQFDAKNNALRDLIEVMNKHNLSFESSVVWGDSGEMIQIRIMQDYFKDGEPITIFSSIDNNKSSIDYMQIAKG